MAEPTIGYDDDSVIPKKRLINLLHHFETSLSRIENVFQQTLPTHFQPPSDYQQWFHMLKKTAQEVGPDYSFLVDKLIKDYDAFSRKPDQERLNQLFNDVKSLQLLLTG